MHYFKHFIVGTVVLIFTQLSYAQLSASSVEVSVAVKENLANLPVAATVKQEKEASFKAVGTSEVSATLLVNGEKLKVFGQSSFHLHATQDDIKRGSVNLGALNITFAKVPQGLLTYGGPNAEEAGNLSFVIDGEQSLEYDIKSGTLYGEIAGLIGANYMGDFALPIKDSEDGDHTEAPRQKARVAVKMLLDEPFILEESDKSTRTKIEMDLSIQADADQSINAYAIELVARPVFEVEYVIAWAIEVAKRLCVQPVRLSRLVWTFPSSLSFDYTGDGLAFGKPEANKQWAKADVVFTWRSWKTIYNPSLFFFSTSEAYDLMNTVDDDDCVEVFFVEGDSGMHTNWGGGASFWGGEAYTKIISSDGNAAGGIDKVHLAHELGHSIDLPHPNIYNSSSTNTLMCPSGYLNDNPARNSQENKNNISNPLFTFALKLVSAGADCTDSSDCGSCP